MTSQLGVGKMFALHTLIFMADDLCSKFWHYTIMAYFQWEQFSHFFHKAMISSQSHASNLHSSYYSSQNYDGSLARVNLESADAARDLASIYHLCCTYEKSLTQLSQKQVGDIPANYFRKCSTVVCYSSDAYLCYCHK